MPDEKKAPPKPPADRGANLGGWPLFDARDVVGLLGVGLVTYGAWLIYQPAAFVVSGALLILAAILLSRRG